MSEKCATPFTFEERKEIQKHISKGISCSETARLIGRSKNGVTTEVRKGGGRFYNAKIAQNLSDKIRSERYEKLSQMNKSNKVAFKLKTRIENLEMQVEILHDCIKELLNK
jgi:IS30 family transposase